jgi:hypothetical protein
MSGNGIRPTFIRRYFILDTRGLFFLFFMREGRNMAVRKAMLIALMRSNV